MMKQSSQRIEITSLRNNLQSVGGKLFWSNAKYVRETRTIKELIAK